MTQPPGGAAGLPPPPPPPPPSGRKPLRAAKVWAGIGSAMLGHLVALGLSLGALASTPAGFGQALFVAGVITEVVLFGVAVIGGIVLAVRGDQGFGLGLIIGWAAGLIVMPLIGMGVCVIQMTRMES